MAPYSFKRSLNYKIALTSQWDNPFWRPVRGILSFHIWLKGREAAIHPPSDFCSPFSYIRIWQIIIFHFQYTLRQRALTEALPGSSWDCNHWQNLNGFQMSGERRKRKRKKKKQAFCSVWTVLSAPLHLNDRTHTRLEEKALQSNNFPRGTPARRP